MTICVVGSINIDLTFEVERFPIRGETILGGKVRHGLGGKGANQAVAAARMGAEVIMLGAVGDDSFGSDMLGALQAESIDVSGTERMPSVATAMAGIYVCDGDNMIVVAPGANGQFRGPPLPCAALERSHIVMGQFEIPLDVTAECLRRSPRGAKKILNAAPALPGGEQLFPLADIVILNEIELAFYAGAPATDDPDLVARQARRLCTTDDHTFIVTLGAKGSVAVTPNSVSRTEACAVVALDTVGAGDCFCGVLAAELDRGMSLDAAIEAATLAAALVVQRPGAAPAMPTRSELAEFAESRRHT